MFGSMFLLASFYTCKKLQLPKNKRSSQHLKLLQSLSKYLDKTFLTQTIMFNVI